MKSINVRLAVGMATIVTTLLVLSASEFRVRAEKDSALPPVIRIAPAAPVFDEKERLGELAQRRARIAQNIGPKSLLILFSGESRVYANDVDYPFRQENNLFYLTNLKQEGATLVLLPGNTQTPEILFLPRRNPAA